MEIPIVTDAEKAQKKEIIVGKTNREAEGQFDREELGDDGFVIKSEGKKLWLVGGEKRGTMYSVYSFLEEYLGVRYFTDFYEKVPEQTTITLDAIEENKQIPVFETRNSFWYDMYDQSLSAKLKLNCPRGRGAMPEELGGSDNWAGSECHTMYDYAEMADDPVYNVRWNEPCVTSEETYQTILKNVRAVLAANPGAKYVSVSQNDGDASADGGQRRVGCECDNCMAAFNKYGTWSGPYIELVNRIAREIKDEYPDIMIHTFAYCYTRRAPEGLKVEDNVMVELCTIEACFRHPYEDYKELTPAEEYDIRFDYGELLKEWGEICNYLSVWDYTTNFGHYNLTFPNFDSILPNARLFAENNVKKVFEQGSYQGENGEFGELRGYLLAKILWNPYMTEEEYNYHMNDFLKNVYGPGWEGIRQYIDTVQEFTKDFHTNDGKGQVTDYYLDYEKSKINEDLPYPEDLTADMIINYENVDWMKYWTFYSAIEFEGDHVVKVGREAFDNALALAETEEQKYICDKSAIQIDYLETYKALYTIEKSTRTIGKIILNYYNDHPDEFDMTMNEFLDLRRAVLAFSNQQYKDAYYAITRKLAEKLIKYDCVMKEGNAHLDLDTINYWDVPYNWEDPIA